MLNIFINLQDSIIQNYFLNDIQHQFLSTLFFKFIIALYTSNIYFLDALFTIHFLIENYNHNFIFSYKSNTPYNY